jgi:hypothetical protein
MISASLCVSQLFVYLATRCSSVPFFCTYYSVFVLLLSALSSALREILLSLAVMGIMISLLLVQVCASVYYLYYWINDLLGTAGAIVAARLASANVRSICFCLHKSH